MEQRFLLRLPCYSLCKDNTSAERSVGNPFMLLSLIKGHTLCGCISKVNFQMSENYKRKAENMFTSTGDEQKLLNQSQVKVMEVFSK